MLTVYRASAGSGKTFTLAVEYIKLLVQNPMAYRHTLAVTFTNKATEEMKMRILSQLYGIWQQLPASHDYIEKVCAELGVTPDYAAGQAGKALTQLLHNYSYFRVETIDSFFQSVLRNLARELELTANLRVGLNDVQVEEQAVDQMIDSLQKTDKMLAWLLRYIMDTIGDDRSWNVIGQIKQFGRTIFRDYYKQESRELNAVIAKEGFIDDYARMLQAIRAKAKARMAAIADDFFEAIAEEGLTVDDFSGKNRGVCSIFIKLQRGEMDESIVTKTVADAVGTPQKWYAKTSTRRELIHALAEGHLGSLLRQAIEEQPRQWRFFKSADLTLRHLSQLRLLNSIETRVRQMNEEANRFLLSDTQQLLYDVIDGSDSPFIFEKIGTQLEHIMIDEFQDTSTVQWKNFKVLLLETLSHQGGSGLIVGDVKQSIYRWRSGDWRLLAGIKDEFAPSNLKPQAPNLKPQASSLKSQITIEKLDTNYRSEPRIINFNNAFFTEAARLEEVTAYDDVCQQWPKGKAMAGHVEVMLLPSEGYAEAMLTHVVDCIKSLVDAGARPRDIAILVRNNAHIPLLANHLLETLPDIDVVSDEAFRLDASPAVQLIVAALRYITHPNDAIVRAFLAKATSGKVDGPLPPSFADHLDELSRLPLYELTEQLYAIFASCQPQTPDSQLLTPNSQLLTLYDKMAEYAGENSGGINDFLRYWDETLCSTTIQSPEVNGLRIISIHKSKGLEFPHVIIPFCDWRLEHSDILWCHPKEEPFSQLPLAPIDYSAKGMKGTIYEADYDEEHQQTLVDNLNLLYVAFTRASRNLFVLGRRGSKASRSALIEQVLQSPSFSEALDPVPSRPDSFLQEEEGVLHFSYGSLSIPPVVAAPVAARQDNVQCSMFNVQCSKVNPFLQKSEPLTVQMAVYNHRVPLGQSSQSTRFASGEDDASRPSNLKHQTSNLNSSYIQLGNVLHNVFSTIRTQADIDQALLMLEQEGIIYDQQITRQRLEQLIRKRLADPRVAYWFAPRWTLYNECTIITPDGQTFRPDRVMTDGEETIVVDFKFGKERDEYHDQVRQYMSLLSQMGMPRVKGFLWFVYSNKIVTVVPEKEPNQ